MRIRPEPGRSRASTAPGEPAPAREPLSPLVSTADESSAGAPPSYSCAKCGAVVRWREVKFCLDRRARFGGRVYCLGCQPEFQAA